jgi:hypothetical protein
MDSKYLGDETMRYLTALLAMWIFTADAYARDEIYTVHDVKVDVKAESAVAAEHKAMQEARAKAFHMLVDRIVPEDQRGGLDHVPAEKLEDMVDSFEVNSSKNSKVRYIATMTFFFDGSAVQRYLKHRTITAVETAQQPLVIVPIFIDQGGIYLWGEQNPWLEAWSKHDKFSAMTPIVVPFGDLKDISLVDGKQIVGGELGSLNELARRYGGAGVVVATMRRDSSDPMSPMTFEASLVGLDGQVQPLNHSLQDTSQGAPAIQFEKAIEQIVKQLEGQARQESKVMQAMAPGQMLVKIPLENHRTWHLVQNTLKNSNEINNLVVKGLSRKQATVLLTYRGTTASLESALGSRGLQLEQLDGQTWVIRTTAPKTSTQY